MVPAWNNAENVTETFLMYLSDDGAEYIRYDRTTLNDTFGESGAFR